MGKVGKDHWWDHLVEPLCSGRVFLEHMAQHCVQVVLAYLQ